MNLELKLFHRTQRELAYAVNKIVDSYWKNDISEQELINGVKVLCEYNRRKLIKDNDFTAIVQQHCGKRRLEVVKQILELEHD